jgi:hypothetical protein
MKSRRIRRREEEKVKEGGGEGERGRKGYVKVGWGE